MKTIRNYSMQKIYSSDVCRERRGHAIFGVGMVIISLLFLFMLSPNAAYAELVCADCHVAPHGANCSAATTTHVVGTGNPYPACTTCHVTQASIPTINVCKTCHGAKYTDAQLTNLAAGIHVPPKTITVTQTANGYITPDTYAGFFTGMDWAYAITPNNGYYVVDVVVDGVSVGAVTTYSFTNIQADHSIQATFAANPTWTVTVTQPANGTITPGTTSLLGGLSQTFTITPNIGYVVDKVFVDGVNVGAVTNYRFNTISADHTISASLVNTYTITASTTSANGSISPAGPTIVPAGGTQTFSITPDPGYKINYVAVNGASVGAVSSYTFSKVSANATIKADLVPITYKITVNQTQNGTITPYTYSGFTTGANQTYKITPNAGYHITGVLVDGVQQGAISSYTFSNIQANHSISATFAINPSYTITASVASGNGSITPLGDTLVVGGLNQKYSIAPAAGNKIYSVLVDGTNVGAVTSYTFYAVSSTHTIAATFGP